MTHFPTLALCTAIALASSPAFASGTSAGDFSTSTTQGTSEGGPITRGTAVARMPQTRPSSGELETKRETVDAAAIGSRPTWRDQKSMRQSPDLFTTSGV
jgi:hypothetical protein